MVLDLQEEGCRTDWIDLWMICAVGITQQGGGFVSPSLHPETRFAFWTTIVDAFSLLGISFIHNE
jgi:hypothetical protein